MQHLWADNSVSPLWVWGTLQTCNFLKLLVLLNLRGRGADPSQIGSTCENKPCSPIPLTEDAKCFQIRAMKKNDNAPAPANGKGGCTLPRTPEPIKVERGADQVLFLSALGDVCDRKETGSLIPFSGEWWYCFPLSSISYFSTSLSYRYYTRYLSSPGPAGLSLFFFFQFLEVKS